MENTTSSPLRDTMTRLVGRKQKLGLKQRAECRSFEYGKAKIDENVFMLWSTWQENNRLDDCLGFKTIGIIWKFNASMTDERLQIRWLHNIKVCQIWNGLRWEVDHCDAWYNYNACPQSCAVALSCPQLCGITPHMPAVVRNNSTHARSCAE